MKDIDESNQDFVGISDDFDDWDEEKQVDFSKSARLDVRAQEIIAEEGSPSVRKALASNPSLVEEWQDYLYVTGDRDIKLELSRNPNISNSLQAQLVSTGDHVIRSHVAKNENISSDLIDELLLDDDEDVLASLAGNPRLEEDQQEELFEKDVKNIAISLAGNVSLSSSLELKLCEKDSDEIFLPMARKKELGLGAQSYMMNNIPNGRTSAVLEALARNPSLKVVYQRQLAERGGVYTVLALLKNPSIREKERQVALQKLTVDQFEEMKKDLAGLNDRLQHASEEERQAFRKYMEYDPNSIFGSWDKHDSLRRVYESWASDESELRKSICDLEGKIEFFRSVYESSGRELPSEGGLGYQKTQRTF